MNNYKLNKPKAFEASESITTQSGIEVANLLRSGIKNQTVILIGHNQKWHEIEIETLRINEENFLENSHLKSAAHYIDVNGISLSDMGIVEEVQKMDYDLQHADFIELQSLFPAYDYIQIAKLHEYEKHNGLPNGKYHKKETLNMLSARGMSINDYISELEAMKNAITEDTYEEVVNTERPQHAIIVDTIPAKPIAPADSVSLQIFEKLTPEKITELQGLRITQEEIVKSNPVVVITNKTTYAQAKKTAAILLSASTSIDGTKGIEATATKYLNTFKTMLKTALLPIAKLTREPYDKQKKLIEDWDNRLLLQSQNRTKELFSVPFVFNVDQDNYNIGTLIVTQKDIDELSDADWNKKVEQGKAIVIALESVKSEQDSKIAALEEMVRTQQEQIKAFMALQNTAITPQQATYTVLTGQLNSNGDVFAPGVLESAVADFKENQNNETEYKYSASENQLNLSNKVINWTENVQTNQKAYYLPHPDNKLLNELDLAHVSVLEEKQYIECREYYAQGLQDAADAIQYILVNPDPTIKKSIAITELIKTWKL